MWRNLLLPFGFVCVKLLNTPEDVYKSWKKKLNIEVPFNTCYFLIDVLNPFFPGVRIECRFIWLSDTLCGCLKPMLIYRTIFGQNFIFNLIKIKYSLYLSDSIQNFPFFYIIIFLTDTLFNPCKARVCN